MPKQYTSTENMNKHPIRRQRDLPYFVDFFKLHGIFTARKRSYWKVMFSLMFNTCVCPHLRMQEVCPGQDDMHPYPRPGGMSPCPSPPPPPRWLGGMHHSPPPPRPRYGQPLGGTYPRLVLPKGNSHLPLRVVPYLVLPFYHSTAQVILIYLVFE